MRTFTASAAILALTTLTSAFPLFNKRQSSCLLPTVLNPGTGAVQNSITQWNRDVNNVNTFLNNAQALIAGNDSNALVAATMTALTSAQDEPCQLMTLASQPVFDAGPAAFTCAVKDLMMVFMTHVIDNLGNIITNPGDDTAVQDAVDDINAFRCCNVLPDADILWEDSADNNALSNVVPTAAQRPNACANIGCTPFCKTLDNTSTGK